MNKEEIDFLKEHINDICKYKGLQQELTYDVSLEVLKRICKVLDFLQQENEKLEIENFNLREYIDIDKMSIPYKNNSFEELLNMPTYKQLQERVDKAINNLEKSIESINNKIVVNPINDYRVVRLKAIRTKCKEILEILKGEKE